MKMSSKVAREWLETRDIIKGVVRELRQDLTEEQVDHASAAVIARLAKADYIIVKTADMKD